MPLSPPEPKQILIIDFQGKNIERNVLVRPVSSWEDLENFDLVKPGVIRKIRGNKKLTLSALVNDQIVAFRDYQKVTTGPELLVVITASGKLYFSGMLADPIVLAPMGGYPLYDSMVLGNLSETPFIVSLPFKENGENVEGIVVTLDSKAYPQKWFGGNPTRLGVVNPTDQWTEPYQHAAVNPLQANTSTDKVAYITEDDRYGVPIVSGRQIRWSWYNPTTDHNSSLAALSELDWSIPANTLLSTPTQISKKAGVAKGIPGQYNVMAIPIFLDNLPNRDITAAVVPPQEGYTHIKFWSTRDGGDIFYLIPKLYNEFGIVVTEPNGAVPITALDYGYTQGVGHAFTSHMVYDGFVPITDDGPQPPSYAGTLLGTISGSGQTGSTIDVALTVAGTEIHRGHIQIGDDPTVYAIVDIQPGSPDQILVAPPIVNAPTSGDNIYAIFTPPTLDPLLITQFNESGETPFDHVNDPPPMCTWGAVFQNRLFLLGLDKTSLYFSRIGDYESFPPNNVFRFSHADFDPVTAILPGRQVGLVSEGADQRLIIAKQQSTYQITGTSILDFQVTGLFSETGVLHKRAAITIGGFTVVQSRQGIEVLQDQVPIYVGSVIKDLIDRDNMLEYGPCFALDRRDEQILMGLGFVPFVDPPQPAITKIVSMRTPRAGDNGSLSPFATITTLPGGPIGIIQECGFGPNPRMLCAGEDGNIYQLFTGGVNVLPGGDTEPVVAVALSQKLPQEDRGLRKIFYRIRFDGNEVNDDDGWRISYSVDDGVFTSETRMYDETLIGRVGKEIVVKIRHINEADEDDLPQLSNMWLEYALIGEAR